MRRQVRLRSALRARATSPALLSAEAAPSGLPGRAFAETLLSLRRSTETGTEERSFRVGALARFNI
jgi:hypothetical protein